MVSRKQREQPIPGCRKERWPCPSPHHERWRPAADRSIGPDKDGRAAACFRGGLEIKPKLFLEAKHCFPVAIAGDPEIVLLLKNPDDLGGAFAVFAVIETKSGIQKPMPPCPPDQERIERPNGWTARTFSKFRNLVQRILLDSQSTYFFINDAVCFVKKTCL